MVEDMIRMSEGNPGAATALCEIMKDEVGFAAVIMLDELKITGYKIWLLYKDIYNFEVKKLVDDLIQHSEKIAAIDFDKIR